MNKLCANCPNFAPFANAAECGQGVCMATYTVVVADGECIYNPKPHICANCQHFVEHDTACMAAQATDPVDECCGFVDVKYTTLVEILTDWLLRKENCESKFAEALEEAKAFVMKIPTDVP